MHFLLILALFAANLCYAIEYNAWVKPVYYADQQYSNDNLYGYSTYSGGILVGIDKQLDACNTLGISANYFYALQDDINDTATKNHINNYAASIYGKRVFKGKLSLDYLFSIGLNDYKNTTQINSNNNASASFITQQIITSAILSKDIIKREIYFVPQLIFNFAYLHQNSYRLQGSNYISDVIGKQNGVLSLGLGFKIFRCYKHKNFNINPELRCLVLYDIFRADINPLTAILIGGPIMMTSNTPQPTSGQFGASIKANMSGGWLGILSYDLLLKPDYFNNIISFKLLYAF